LTASGAPRVYCGRHFARDDNKKVDPFFYYLAIGAVAGVLAGLLGVGGGLVIVPTLVFAFRQSGFAEASMVHLAVGTSLATIVFTSISSVRAHHKRGAVMWPVVARLAPGLVAGALLGAAIADRLPTPVLARVFGIFEFAVAAQMILNRRPKPQRQLPRPPGMFAAGGVIGTISAIIGIGGGSMTVPFLVWCNQDARRAVATSSACGMPIALGGAVGFAIAGWGNASLPHWSLGYVYLPALLGVTLASVPFAPLGARLAHTLPTDSLKKIFALLLVGLGVKMIMG
jgi:uncharacterized membrane protein YfcA